MNQLSNKKYDLELKIALLALAIFVFMPKAADAAFIVQRPLYIGLGSGLVGYWSFDPVRDKPSQGGCRHCQWAGWISNGVDGQDMTGNQKPSIAAGLWQILIQNGYSSFTT